MKIASLDDGTRDGRLVAVANDHSIQRRCTDRTLREALDAQRLVPEFTEQPFSENLCGAILPRATQFLDASAYVNHVDLVRRARGAEMPESFWTDPLMYQGCSTFLGPQDNIIGDVSWGMDFEAEVAVITSDVHQGVNAEEAPGFIEYILLINDISLRALIPDELSKGFGFVQSKPPSATSPLAVPHEECPGWKDGKLHGILNVDLNGQPFGRADAGVDMTFDFGTLIAHAAKTRPLGAGTIIGSGTVSNRDADGGPGKPVAQGGRGYSCIAEQRMVETIQTGAPKTPFLQPGDKVKIWMEDASGQSIFGAIEQEVAPWP